MIVEGYSPVPGTLFFITLKTPLEVYLLDKRITWRGSISQFNLISITRQIVIASERGVEKRTQLGIIEIV